MKHLKGFRKLNRTASHRKALYSNMAIALFRNERIKTTLQKAKELRRVVAKLITRAKVENLHNIRLVAKVIKDKTILSKLFKEIATRYIERKGGYTRIIKLDRRKGDGAQMAFIELVGEQIAKKKKKKPKLKVKTEEQKKKIDKKETSEIKTEKKDETKVDETNNVNDNNETKTENDTIEQNEENINEKKDNEENNN